MGKRPMNYPGRPSVGHVTVVSAQADSASSTNRLLYAAVAGGALLALLAGAGIRLMGAGSTPNQPVVTESDEPAATVSPSPGAPSPNFSEPFVSASPSLRLADPALLQSTVPQARVETVASGRPDPFAPLVTPSRVPSRPTLAAVPAPPAPAAAAQAPAPVPAPVPVVPVANTQSLPPLPTALPLPSLPAPFVPGALPLMDGEVAIAPTAPVFQSLIDQVEVSGVVQIGGAAHAIITEPGDRSGRRVSQGDLVAGGRIRVKSIDVSGGDPIVILTYDGQDYPRTVGSGAMTGML